MLLIDPQNIAASIVDPKDAAESAGLRYVSDEQPGIRRKKAGTGFTYTRTNGSRLIELEALKRIRALAIPPAWTDVWICSFRDGHIQATGRDAKGRKQYRNEYLKEITGKDITAKDFRTWARTVLAAMALAELESFDNAAQAKRNLRSTIEKVAARLGNNPLLRCC